MKAVFVYITLFASTWALPNTPDYSQLDLPPKRLYVEPTAEKLPSDVGPRIINGREAIPHSIPYQVYLLVFSSGIGGWTCGGSLISPTHILTAAHCLVGAARVSARLGAHNIQGNEDSQTVVESPNLIPHKDYNETTISDDIGLVVLDEPVELNEYIAIAPLPSREDTNDFAGDDARVSGWGLSSQSGDRPSVLQEANVTIISNVECRQIYSIVIDSQLCTVGNEEEAVCDGDSGGPLAVGDTQVGVVSYGAGCDGRYPSGYTRISSYLNWLEDNTGLKF